MFFFLLFHFLYHTQPPSFSLSCPVYKTVATEREKGGWTLTLYKESSSSSSPMPKYGQCESEKVHVRVRVSVREAEKGGESWKRRRDEREEDKWGVGLENENLEVKGERKYERKRGRNSF